MRRVWLKLAGGAVVAAAVVTCALLVKAHFAFAPSIAEEDVSGDREVVVLVHGMGRTPLSMTPLARALEAEGYETVSWGYSSTCCSAEELADKLAEELEAVEASAPESVHFVGHSLGNVVIQLALEERPSLPEGRIVMLAPPSRGASSADRYEELAGWLLEPMDDLTTGEDSTARRVSARFDDREIGVIAGDRDGKVSVDESHHQAQTDHAVVSAFHTFIMARAEVRELTASFLAQGRFPATARSAGAAE